MTRFGENCFTHLVALKGRRIDFNKKILFVQFLKSLLIIYFAFFIKFEFFTS